MLPTNQRIIINASLSCALLIAGLWLLIAIAINHERESWTARALLGVRSLAESYAEQVDKSIEQIDLMSSTLVYMKEHAVLPAVLDQQFQYRAADSPMFAAYIDADGVIRSARRAENLGTRFGTRDFFDHHRNSASRAMLINPRSRGVGTLSNQEVIRFTRRVNKPDGSFDGIVTISLNHTYLQSYKSAGVYGKGDFSSLWLQQGSLLTNWTIGLGDQIFQHYRTQPDFESDSGARFEPAEKFHENEAGFVGWRKLKKYPLVALTVIREDNAMRSFEMARNSYLLAGVAGSLLVAGVGTAVAVSRMRRAARRRQMRAIADTFRLAIDTGQQALLMVVPVYDAKGVARKFRIEDCSEHTGELAGVARQELLGRTLDEVLSPADAARLGNFLQVALSTGINSQELQLFHRDGMPARWFDSRAVRSTGGVALSMQDVTELKEKQRELVTMAHTDALTALPNRTWLREFLPSAFALADAQQLKLALLLIDIDDFKRINDSIGHEAGDDFLVAFGKALAASVRSGDHVARVGGDKFGVLLQGIRDHAEVEALVAHLRQQLGRVELDPALAGYVIDESIGVAIYPDDAVEPAALLNAADIAMYDATLRGRAATVFYSLAISENLQTQFRLERELNHALLNDELALHFQPRALLSSGMLAGFEALVRWQHPVRGLVPPSEFVPAAEQSGLIVSLGEWLIERACADIARWRDQGLPLATVSINISAKQLKSPACRQHILASLARHGLAPGMLAIELTESTMVGDDPVVRQELRELRALGIELHIDDFGTGYSSLSQLQQLDVDAVKIDQSFVRELGERHQSEALCRAIIEMSKVLGFTVVAEGVETRAQLELLRRMGCDEIQGYLLSRPVPADGAAYMLAHPALLDAEAGPAPA